MLRSLVRPALIPALVLICPHLHAQAPAPAPEQLSRLDAKLKRWFPADQPGAAVLLARDGKVLFKKAYGTADASRKTPLQPDMSFRIGSITKQFTAAAVMKLVEEGKIDVGAPVSRYLDGLPDAWKAITVEQLLTHSSGLHNYTDVDAFWEDPARRYRPAELLDAFICKLPLDFIPGTQYRYSNTGYILLGMLIEKVSGKDYPTFLQERLLTPLGLKHTCYDSDEKPVAGLPVGYIKGLRPASFWSVTTKYSAGGLVSTVDDLARWTQALHEGRVLKPESLQRMLTPALLADGVARDYGYGLAFRTVEGHRLIGHDGQVRGFSSLVEADPKTGCVAVILANTSGVPADTDYFSRYLLAMGAGQAPADLRPAAVEPSRLERLCGFYSLDGATRMITCENGKLFSRKIGNPRFEMIPLSDTLFGFEDSDDRTRFELTGDTVAGLHKGYGEGPEGPLCRRLEPLQDPSPEVTDLVKACLKDLSAGTLKRELFTVEMVKALFPDGVKSMAADMRALGQPTAVTLYERWQRDEDATRYFYRLAFREKSLSLYLWLDKAHKISGVWTYLD